MAANAPLIPGVNVDILSIEHGLKELTACEYTDPHTCLVIEYALMRHARGEEAAAQRAAIDATFHGISLTCWYRVLAAALAGAAQGKYANAVRNAQGNVESFMPRVNGAPFRCECGANVFHKPDKNDLNLFECNACETRFMST